MGLKELFSSREFLATSIALLKHWDILVLNKSVGERLNWLVVEGLKIECALGRSLWYDAIHSKTHFLVITAPVVISNAGQNHVNLTLPFYHDHSPQASLHHFFPSLPASLVGGIR
jgi:hypothetical protein